MNETGRVEAFSDGVLAIAITLLVLELPVPKGQHGTLAHALVEEWPSFAAYVTSFLVIGIIWINHHQMFGLIARIDRQLMFLNLLLLLFVALIPFSTALLAEYLTEGGSDARTAAVVYSLGSLGTAAAFGVLYRRAARHPALLADHVDAAAVRGSVGRFSVGLVGYLVTVVVALFSAPACLAVHFAMAVYYSFEQTRGMVRPRAEG